MNEPSKLTRNEERLLELFNNTTDEGRIVIIKAITCAAIYGEEMLNDAKEYIEKGDSEGIRAVVDRYYQKLEETKK